MPSPTVFVGLESLRLLLSGVTNLQNAYNTLIVWDKVLRMYKRKSLRVTGMDVSLHSISPLQNVAGMKNTRWYLSRVSFCTCACVFFFYSLCQRNRYGASHRRSFHSALQATCLRIGIIQGPCSAASATPSLCLRRTSPGVVLVHFRFRTVVSSTAKPAALCGTLMNVLYREQTLRSS